MKPDQTHCTICGCGFEQYAPRSGGHALRYKTILIAKERGWPLSVKVCPGCYESHRPAPVESTQAATVGPGEAVQGRLVETADLPLFEAV